MNDNVLIIDFGSQFTQLIARRVREMNVYCEIHPYNNLPDNIENFKAVILSGSPFSAMGNDAPSIDLNLFRKRVPLLGICFGAQYLAHNLGGKIESSEVREYGRAKLNKIFHNSSLFKDINIGSQVWMSHGDTIFQLPENFELIASTEDVENAAFKIKDEETYGIQFHPEVSHSLDGAKLLKNFVIEIAKCEQTWTPDSFVESSITNLKNELGNDIVVLGLSGGVDSTVAAILLHKAIGKNLHCIFVDNGLLRKNEFNEVLESYKHMGLNIVGVDASKEFLSALEGISDPEAKRKAIGKTFIDIFDREAQRIKDVKWLAQGTIYPDVIESVSVKGPSATIKSHHNVGGLPDYMKLKIVEPLRLLFKDEVREVGTALDIDANILNRHPFPGPGLAIRILGDITEDKIKIIQEVDDIYIKHLRESGCYEKIWQAGAILLPINSVGVMGDERTYERVVALRAVSSIDGMTADWVQIPYEILAKISNDIINKVKGVNRVVYDISSKPPSTIEWE
ncbi:MAG: glutamine-hydrolyzing GMP synthase [Bacteroidales bacterium]|mgnify:CR=1 FL=1|jgi:GMP synthase (glutamine-hydrolysing)|nr:glutamine-hydrolyzing GMP synthase [Bacteroidales bacterium]